MQATARPELNTRIASLNYRLALYGLFNVATLGSVFFFPFRWEYLALAAVTYYGRMLAITGVQHRYFAHKAYRVQSRTVRFLLGAWATTAAQRGPLWWAATHRWHHRHSDGERDIHSRRHRGFWYAHVIWVFDMYNNLDWEAPELSDLRQYPELVFLEKWNLVGPLALGILLFGIGGLPWVVWGLGVSTVALWHGASSINSVAHRPGAQQRNEQRFDTGDDSRNLWWNNFFTLGEGWHNNHHYYPSAARNGFYPTEIDPTFYMLKTLCWLGLIQDLKPVPSEILIEGRTNDEKRRHTAT